MHPPNMLSLLSGALLAGSAIAGHPHKAPQELDPLAIAHAIEAISESTKTLGNTLVERPINVIKAAIVQSQSSSVANKIKKGIKIAQESKGLDMSTGFPVLVATENLVGVVNRTMTAIIDAHSEFESMPLVPLLPFLPMVPYMDSIVLKSLRKQSELSSKFGDLVLAKVPSVGRQDGKTRLMRIARSFEQAIAVYEGKVAAAEEVAAEEEVVDEKTAVPFTA